MVVGMLVGVVVVVIGTRRLRQLDPELGREQAGRRVGLYP
ncbi:MAG: hypothetical protein JWN67_3655 [Actinomycetia bacterium]|nr:hypothetical protein [Actinomycetes bacterium]